MGIYRLLLACCVVFQHLLQNHYSIGMFAVFGFYVLSGFLITRVLHQTYHFNPVTFWSSRALRLAPLYAIFLTTGLLLVFGTHGAGAFFPAVWQSSPRAMDWLGVLTVVPMGLSPMDWHFRPVPPIWSVAVELLNYVVLFVFTARSRRAALLTAVGAALYHVWSIWHGDDIGARYFPFYAALLPFALGSLIYFDTRSRKQKSIRTVVVLCVPAALVVVATEWLGAGRDTMQFQILYYGNLAAQCLAFWALALMVPLRRPGTDKWWGDLSYPMFLGHWQVGYVLTLLLPFQAPRGFGLMLATLAASAFVAYFACRVQDAIIEPIRNRLRAKVLSAPAQRIRPWPKDECPSPIGAQSLH